MSPSYQPHARTQTIRRPWCIVTLLTSASFLVVSTMAESFGAPSTHERVITEAQRHDDPGEPAPDCHTTTGVHGVRAVPTATPGHNRGRASTFAHLNAGMLDLAAWRAVGGWPRGAAASAAHNLGARAVGVARPERGLTSGALASACIALPRQPAACIPPCERGMACHRRSTSIRAART